VTVAILVHFPMHNFRQLAAALWQTIIFKIHVVMS